MATTGATVLSGGCVGNLSGSPNPKQPCESLRDADSPENEPGKNVPEVRVESDDSNLDDARIAVDIVRHFDETAPARILITFVNESTETNEYDFGSIQPFTGLEGTHVTNENRLFLHPAQGRGFDIDGDVPEAPTNGCWQLPTDQWGITDLPTSAELAPCESVSMEYDLFDLPGGPCLAEGEYRFESGDVGAVGHEWGFWLTLAK